MQMRRRDCEGGSVPMDASLPPRELSPAGAPARARWILWIGIASLVVGGIAVIMAIAASYPLHAWTLPQEATAITAGVSFAVIGVIFVRLHGSWGAHPHPESLLDQSDLDLGQYFTNAEALRQLFAERVRNSGAQKRVLFIHGISAIGKTTLLRMFRLDAISLQAPVAFASGDDSGSVEEILRRWSHDLHLQHITLPRFSLTLRDMHLIRPTFDGHHATHTRRGMADSRKDFGRVIDIASAAANSIPFAGGLITIALIALKDKLVERLHGLVPESEIDLFRDLSERLLHDFLADLAMAAQSRREIGAPRIVLLLDGLDRLGSSDMWLADFASKLGDSALLVVSGRRQVDWRSRWRDWNKYSQAAEVPAMTPGLLRELAARYYRFQLGYQPDPVRIEQIVRVAEEGSRQGGLPLTITFLIDRLGEAKQSPIPGDTPGDYLAALEQIVQWHMRNLTPELRRVFEAAAVLRGFNRELLCQTLGVESLDDDLFAALTKYSYSAVRVRQGHLPYMLHDTIRGSVEEYLSYNEPEHLGLMHERAARYFKSQLATSRGGEEMANEAEWIYHLVRYNEDQGIEVFRTQAAIYARHQLLDHLRNLVGDAQTYHAEQPESTLWVDYYGARLMDMEGNGDGALTAYEAIGADANVGSLLRVHALCSALWLIRFEDRPRREEILEQLAELFDDDGLQEAAAPEYGRYLIEAGLVDQQSDRWDDARSHLAQALQVYERTGDLYGQIDALNRLKYFFVDQGMWRDGWEKQQEGLRRLGQVAGERNQSYLRAELLGGGASSWIWAGCYKRAEKQAHEALASARKAHRVQQEIYFLRDLGIALGYQGNADEAERCFQRGCDLAITFDPFFEMDTAVFRALVALRQQSPDTAAAHIDHALEHQARQAKWWEPTFYAARGMVREAQGQLEAAKEDYQQGLSMHALRRNYWLAGAALGLARIAYRQGNAEELIEHASRAEQLAQEFGFVDYLAALHLLQGHNALRPVVRTWPSGAEAALRCYQEALIYGLQYNRFLLDELLVGHAAGTTLAPLVAFCRDIDTEESRRVVRELKAWWESGTVDEAMLHPLSLTALQAGIPLLQAERSTRQREPGMGEAQLTVGELLG